MCGTDFRDENASLHNLPDLLGLRMDRRNKKGWEELLANSFGLTAVSSVEIPNPNQPTPTLFVWGYKPVDQCC